MKDAFYFSHDSNARNDSKIVRMRMELGWEGYGLYWGIIEMLRDEREHKMQLDCKCIAFALHADLQTIQTLIQDFDLFKIDCDFFWSESLCQRMKHRKTVSKSRREAAEKRWNNNELMQKQCKSNANALQMQCIKKEKKGKERKRKEKKGKEKYDPQLRAIATSMFDFLIELKPDRKDVKVESIDRWISDIDRLNRIDNRSYDEIQQIVNWLFRDYRPNGEFDWRMNIKSGAKLRKHFDMLQMMKTKVSMTRDNIAVKSVNTEINLENLYD